jgi:hypothetical protein
MSSPPGAGYSSRPLAAKLGIGPGSVLALLGAPEDAERLLAASLPGDVELRRSARGRVHVALLFVSRRAELARRIPALERAIFPDGALWVAWPKRASGVATDMTEDVVREVALPRGLVDNKVAAIDATWSGLRLVHRKERRRVWDSAG